MRASSVQPGVHPPPRGEGHEAVRSGDRCRNCGAVATDAYCPACGQGTVLHPPTVGEFVHEFLGHHVALEGSLWRTLAALLVTPGRLTVEYFAGRRQRYIPPLRLYLTFSLILFAVSGLQGSGLRLGNESLAFGIPEKADGAMVIAPLPRRAPSNDDGWLARFQARVAAMTPEQRSQRIATGVRQYLPYVLIVMVPLLAFLLKLAYWNRGLLYGEHLVVAFHAQTVAYVFSIMSAIPMGDIVGPLWSLLLGVHGAVALRRVYGGRWIATLAREALVLTVYTMLVGLALSALVAALLMF